MKIQVDVNNNCFYALESGKGPAIILLSGFGCTHYLFEEMLIDLEKYFTVIRFDHRGTGLNSHLNNGQTSIASMAKDAHDFMMSLGYKSYSVLGISMGGFVAQEMAIKFQNNIQSLGLLCTTSGGEGFIPLPKLTLGDVKAYYSKPWKETARQVVLRTVSARTRQDNNVLNHIVKHREENPVAGESIANQKVAVDGVCQDRARGCGRGVPGAGARPIASSADHRRKPL